MWEACLFCAGRGSSYDPHWYTLAEWNVLIHRTGRAPEAPSHGVVDALWLPRKGAILLPGCRRPIEIAWDVLALRCPWSRPDAPQILTLRQRYELGAAGVIYPPRCVVDQHGCIWDNIGCWGARGSDGEGPEKDFLPIRPFSDPALPRRRVGEP
jgi:hypothetical protein